MLLLEGPRSVGKSTVLRELARDALGPVLDLEDPVAAADAAASPSSFLPPACGRKQGPAGRILSVGCNPQLLPAADICRP